MQTIKNKETSYVRLKSSKYYFGRSSVRRRSVQ